MVAKEFKVTEATVITGRGADWLYLTVTYSNGETLPTPYPNCGYQPCIKMEVAGDYGEEYCKTVFGIIPKIIHG